MTKQLNISYPSYVFLNTEMVCSLMYDQNFYLGGGGMDDGGSDEGLLKSA